MKKVMVVVMGKNNIPTCYYALGKNESVDALKYLYGHANSRIRHRTPKRERIKRFFTVVSKIAVLSARRISYIASAIKTAFSKEFKKPDIDRRQDTSVSAFNCRHVIYPIYPEI